MKQKKHETSKISQWLPLLVIAVGLCCFYAFGLNKYISYNAMKEHSTKLLSWTHSHYFLTALSYSFIYIVAVTLSIPGAIFLTLAGGFLFGKSIGTVVVLISATLGATLLFLIVRNAFVPLLAKKAKPWVIKMQKGFGRNAFNYLLFLRFIPIFPFWAVNIVPALLDVKLSTFIVATFIGIIPGTFIYVSIGSGLSRLFELNQTPNLNIIFAPYIILPLMALALLCILPIFYKLYKRAHK